MTMYDRAADIANAWAKIRTEDDYINFVRLWKKTHEILLTHILEHKNAQKHERASNHHQAMAKKYGSLARAMYDYRNYAKNELHSGNYVMTFKKKVAEVA